MTDPDEGDDRVLLPPLPALPPDRLPDAELETPSGTQHDLARPGDAQHHSPATPSAEGVQHQSLGPPSAREAQHLTAPHGAQHQSFGAPAARDAQHQLAPEVGAQHQSPGPASGGGRWRAVRHAGKARYFVAAGAAAAAVTTAALIVKAQDDSPTQSVVAAEETVATPVGPLSTGVVTSESAAGATAPAAAAADTAPDTVAATVAATEASTVEPTTAVGGTTPGPATTVRSGIVSPPVPVASSIAAAVPLPPVPDAACAAEASSRSLNGDVLASLTVVNNTAETVQSIWLDYDGNRVVYQQIAPFTSYVQPTWLTHPWIIANEQGTCYRLVVMSSPAQTVTVDPG